MHKMGLRIRVCVLGYTIDVMNAVNYLLEMAGIRWAWLDEEIAQASFVWVKIDDELMDLDYDEYCRKMKL